MIMLLSRDVVSSTLEGKKQEVVTRKVTRSEIVQRWIYVPSMIHSQLSKPTIIPVTVSDKVIQMKVNSYGYMTPQDITWARFTKLLNLEKGDTIEFKQSEDGMLEICVPMVAQKHERKDSSMT